MPDPSDDGRILDISNAQVYRGDTCVFDNLSFILERDQHTAILGPNGAGKSTILKLLAGEVHAVPNDHTSIRLFGLTQWNVWEVRKRLGIVSHDLQSIFGLADFCIFVDATTQTITARGTPQELLRNPPNERVAEFLTRRRVTQEDHV